MTLPLFRQDAIEEQKDRLYGEVLLSQPLSLPIITFSILFVVIVITLLLVYGTYARREAVVGYLVPDKGLVKIYAPLQGILSELHIKEGQKVTKGQTLLTVSTLRANKDGADQGTLVLNKLQQRKSSLQEKIKQEKLLHNSKTETIVLQIAGIERELSQLKVSIGLQQKQLKLSKIKLADMKALLVQGFISENKVKDAEQITLDSELRFKSTQRQQIQLENKLNDFQQEQKQIPLEWLSQLSDLDRNLSDIEQQILEILGRRVYTIRAPISGRLTVLQITEGQTLDIRLPLLAIVPEGTELQAELFLPTRAAGFISQGQKVYLRYGAFPYQHYGLYEGKVNNIAQVILTPNELPIPVPLKEPVYRVKVLLDKQTVTAYGKEFQLQAGMLLGADIVLEERTLGQWLFEPIYGLKGR